MARHAVTGATFLLLKESEARAAAVAKGYRWAAPPPAKRPGAAASNDDDARRAKAARLRRTHALAVAALVAKAEVKAADAGFWRLIVRGLLAGSWHDAIAATVARRGWAEKKIRPEATLEKRIAPMAMLVILAISRSHEVRGLAFHHGLLGHYTGFLTRSFEPTRAR
jgi:hypothetical protein